jgi:hypothetical protein
VVGGGASNKGEVEEKVVGAEKMKTGERADFFSNFGF